MNTGKISIALEHKREVFSSLILLFLKILEIYFTSLCLCFLKRKAGQFF